MLHTINKSPFDSSSMETCFRFLQAGDAVLFLEDGVYAAQAGTKFAQAVDGALQKNALYVLEPDATARGIKNFVSGVQPIDYEGFVELVEQHQVNSWF
jgi:tRNA 2-thiouridine synthesizing protein B|uniref:DsrH protein n=1 Tax=Chlorobium chlorochromatii (strain CaD3) TaxID=340177 RepID=Q3AP77_CHLCH